jgi:hypothetical protein
MLFGQRLQQAGNMLAPDDATALDGALWCSIMALPSRKCDCDTHQDAGFDELEEKEGLWCDCTDTKPCKAAQHTGQEFDQTCDEYTG